MEPVESNRYVKCFASSLTRGILEGDSKKIDFRIIKLARDFQIALDKTFDALGEEVYEYKEYADNIVRQLKNANECRDKSSTGITLPLVYVAILQYLNVNDQAMFNSQRQQKLTLRGLVHDMLLSSASDRFMEVTSILTGNYEEVVVDTNEDVADEPKFQVNVNSNKLIRGMVLLYVYANKKKYELNGGESETEGLPSWVSSNTVLNSITFLEIDGIEGTDLMSKCDHMEKVFTRLMVTYSEVPEDEDHMMDMCDTIISITSNRLIYAPRRIDQFFKEVSNVFKSTLGEINFKPKGAFKELYGDIESDIRISVIEEGE